MDELEMKVDQLFEAMLVLEQYAPGNVEVQAQLAQVNDAHDELVTQLCWQRAQEQFNAMFAVDVR